MDISERVGQQILLFTLIALIVPMVAFPAQFGTQLTRGSLLHVMFELVFYGIVIILFYRCTSLLQLIRAAGLCLVYRLAIGALFGLFIAAFYSMGIKISLTLGVSSYLPAILFHIAVTPFILKPVVVKICHIKTKPHQPVRSAPTPTSMQEEPEQGRTTIAISKQRGVVKDQTAAPQPTPSPETPTMKKPVKPAPVQTSLEQNGFERAVKYLGEHSSVNLAVVADTEGLPLASFKRGVHDTENWAPLAELFFEGSHCVLRRGNLGEPEKLDLTLEDKRIIAARAGALSLIVVSDRQADDVLNIRISQAQDMIRKYVDERYSDELNLNAEKIHVSST